MNENRIRGYVRAYRRKAADGYEAGPNDSLFKPVLLEKLSPLALSMINLQR